MALVEDRLIVGINRSAPDGWPVLEMPEASLLQGRLGARPSHCSAPSVMTDGPRSCPAWLAAGSGTRPPDG